MRECGRVLSFSCARACGNAIELLYGSYNMCISTYMLTRRGENVELVCVCAIAITVLDIDCNISYIILCTVVEKKTCIV